ncbi:MAG: DegT/DnrJ/EryC1/StrS family aminotransferase [Oscillospiraceae bacterium]|nr:DegT/DnrJ/EryC1/StrS family aminotransferase [Oscillospiraceae bacterium]
MSLLAIAGGNPVKKQMGSYAAWPVGDDKMAKTIIEVVKSGIWGTLGPKCDEFSKKYAEYTQSGYCIPVTSGTVGLEVILRGLGIGCGDEVIVPPYTFAATISAVIITGALPVFADIESDTYTLNPESAEKAVTERTKAIIGVHLGGRAFDADKLSDAAKKYNLYLIEDAAHAQGSEWDGKRAGSLGDAASFSFQNSKNLPAGEAGAVTAGKREIYEKIWAVHNNGRGCGETELSTPHPFVGTNARMTEWQAAVLCAGLERLDADIERRTANADYLDKEFRAFPFLEPMKKDMKITRNSYHLYTFRYKKEGLYGISREKFINALNAENVCSAADGYSFPIYEMQMMYGGEFKKITGRDFINPKENLPNNEIAAYSEGAWIYHSSLLGEKSDMDAILEAVEKIYKNKDELKL